MRIFALYEYMHMLCKLVSLLPLEFFFFHFFVFALRTMFTP